MVVRLSPPSLIGGLAGCGVGRADERGVMDSF
jgi:hypothetical protein